MDWIVLDLNCINLKNTLADAFCELWALCVHAELVTTGMLVG